MLVTAMDFNKNVPIQDFPDECENNKKTKSKVDFTGLYSWCISWICSLVVVLLFSFFKVLHVGNNVLVGLTGFIQDYEIYFILVTMIIPCIVNLYEMKKTNLLRKILFGIHIIASFSYGLVYGIFRWNNKENPIIITLCFLIITIILGILSFYRGGNTENE